MAEQPIQSIEKLQVRHTELNKKKIQTETQCENAKRELDALQKQAMENYGTHDVADCSRLSGYERINPSGGTE